MACKRAWKTGNNHYIKLLQLEPMYTDRTQEQRIKNKGGGGVVNHCV